MPAVEANRRSSSPFPLVPSGRAASRFPWRLSRSPARCPRSAGRPRLARPGDQPRGRAGPVLGRPTDPPRAGQPTGARRMSRAAPSRPVGPHHGSCRRSGGLAWPAARRSRPSRPAPRRRPAAGAADGGDRERDLGPGGDPDRRARPGRVRLRIICWSHRSRSRMPSSGRSSSRGGIARRGQSLRAGCWKPRPTRPARRWRVPIPTGRPPRMRQRTS